MKVKRNYQFMQFLLDLFSLFQLFLMTSGIISSFWEAQRDNARITAPNGEDLMQHPEPIVIWGVLSLIVFAAAIVLPVLFKKKTKFNQKQFDIWVYAVYLIRVLALLILFYMLDIHVSFIKHRQKSLIDFSIIASAVLIAFIVRFTQIRIKKAGTKEVKDKREFTED